MRCLRPARRDDLPPLPGRAPTASRSVLRTVWRAHRLARRPLPRVRRPAARVRLLALRRRLLGPGASARRSLEGARAAAPRRRGGRHHRDDGRETTGGRARVRSRRRRSERQARPPSGRAARPRAGIPLGASRVGCAQAVSRTPSAARADAGRAAPERRRRVRRRLCCAGADRAHRRRLHDRSDRLGSLLRAAPSRRAARRRRDVRPGHPAIESNYRSRPPSIREASCDCR